jgi:PST family polysaccharide transporter
MASGILMTGAAYAVRVVIVRYAGIQAAGFYQSAWAVGGLYVGFVLDAMGTDFYPRLAGAIRDRAECNRLVNEQAQVSLLLAGPGVLATLAFAPLVLSVFYSGEFAGAVTLLRWLCLGAAMRVITWPMGFIIVADAKQTIFLAVETAYVVVYVAVAAVCVRWFGVDGAGIAFLVSYVFHGLMIYPVVRRLSGFRWSAENRRLMASFVVLIFAVFCGFALLPGWLATLLALAALLGNTWFSLRELLRLVSTDRLPRKVRRLLVALGLSAGGDAEGAQAP